MDNCYLTVNHDEVLAKIRKGFAKTSLDSFKYISKLAKDGEITKEFILHCKKMYGKKFNINTASAIKLADAAIDFYAFSRWDINNMSRKKVNNSKGYNSMSDEEAGKRHCAVMVLDVFNSIRDGIIAKENANDSYYAKAVRDRWNNIIFAEIARINNENAKKPDDHKSIKDIKEEWEKANDKLAYVRDALSSTGELTIQNQNKLAVYQELNGTEEHLRMYMSEVMANPILKNARSADNEIYEESPELDNIDQQNTGNKTDEDKTDSENDEYFKQFDHSGEHKDFKSHISARLQDYFNALRKFTSIKMTNNGHYAEDLNNSFGIAETMTVEQCSSILLQSSFRNIEEFIKAVDRISRTVDGYQSFSKFYQDLKNDPDFACECFTVFAKTKVAKLEIRYEDNKGTSLESNSDADKRASFLFNLQNDIRNTIANVDLSVNEELIIKGIDSIDKINKTFINNKKLLGEELEKANKALEEQYNKEESSVVSLIRGYFSSIEEGAIISYINNTAKTNDIIGKADVLFNLYNRLKKLNNNLTESKRLYNEQQTKIAQIKAHNEKLTEQIKNGIYADKEDFLDSSKAYEIDTITDKVATNILDIRDIFIDYSFVNTTFNSVDVHRNLSSDILNNSMITNLIKTLESGNTEEVLNWGERKLKAIKNRYNPILVTQYDDNNNKISEGIFRYVNDTLTLEPNALNTLKFYLFNGSSNYDNGKAAKYNEMTPGDFVPTLINAYFSQTYTKGKQNLGTYFLRTPSDAPKTFAVRSQRFDTSDLFIYPDEKIINDEISDILNSITDVPKKLYNTVVNKTDNGLAEAYAVTHKALINILTGKTPLNIKNRNYIGTDGEKTYATILDSSTNTYYIVSGNATDKGMFLNVSLEGTFEYRQDAKGNIFVNKGEVPKDVENKLSDYYRNLLSEQDVEVKGTKYSKQNKVINRNSVAYKLVYNQFKQEMLSAVIARDVMFETESDGTIKKSNGNPIRTKNSGYVFYHTDEDGNVYKKVGESFKLLGKVFGSNKFTLFSHKDGIGYTKNYMNSIFNGNEETGEAPLIDFFYGGDNVNGIGVYKNKNGEIVDVIINNTQKEAICDAIDSWINDYINQANLFIEEYKDFLGDRILSRDDIADFSINYYLALCSHDSMLDGDSKYYKSTQTILKRAKEYQGSGIPYGIIDYVNEVNYRKAIVGKTLLDAGTITTGIDADGNPIKKTFSEIFEGTQLEGLQMFNKFRAVTVKNTKSTNEKALKELKKQLVDYMSKTTTKEKAEARVDDMLYGPKDKKGVRRGGFTETKVNDAQSYITLEEFVRRVAAKGQLRKYIPTLEKLMFSPETLTAKDIEEFIQVQKNFYYDLYYDEVYKDEVPRQIKNAELVLVPYFIKGTQLEAVYNIMKEAGIDQLNTVETSKAANKNVLTLWDDNGNISKAKYASFAEEAKSAMQEYDYNYLYTQQETPQHMNSSNKAGIQIVKKIIDNITQGISSPTLYKKKLEYFNLFVENIYGSYEKLIDDLEVEFNEDGQISNINNKVLLSKLKGELVRRGLDKNMNDYVTLVNGQPRMNPCINSIISTYESIIQGFINRNITRQTLPGFHAAQVTNVGYTALDITLLPNNQLLSNEKFKKFVEENNKEIKNGNVTEKIRKEFKEWLKVNGNEVSYDTDLRYHPVDEDGTTHQYIEVKVPLSYLGINRNSKHYKGMKDEDILKELASEKLDMLIGYRIPTEGKQSVAIMKVVGILNDAQGSTIVVPNDWVSQTGSDFDIDSVYAITYESYLDKDGIKRRIKYNDKEERTPNDYYYYLKSKLEDKESLEETKEDKKEKLNKLNDIINDRYNDYKTALNDAISKLPEIYSKRIPAIRKKIKGDNAFEFEYKAAKAVINDIQLWITAQQNSEKGKVYLSKHPEVITNLQNYADALIDYINELQRQPGDRFESTHKINDEYLKALNDIAKDNNLPTFEKFKTLPKEKINSRQARNNRILELMIDIMNEPSSLEEQMLRSNFDDIIAALNRTMSSEVKAEREARSSYNIFDQIKFQNEAMSGATLKAFSVSLDTFCSVCNTVRPILSVDDEILVVYDTDTVLNNIDEKAFNLETSDLLSKGYIVNHNSYGWSKNNKNIVGRILTAYSSETTAHILDAIKEGSIPNVNEFTFGVYKTLANIGCDYDTIVSFIMQPGISRIVKAYNANKSIFYDSFSTPFNIAIREIAKELGVKTEAESITNILSQLQNKYGDEFTKLFKVNEKDPHINLNNKNLKNIPIIGSKLIDRLNNTGKFSSPVEESTQRTTAQLLFDLGTILTFYKLNTTANEIGALARCCNPDKFGAKQSIYAARKTLTDIYNSIYKKNTFKTLEVKNPVLSVNGEHILESIYPGISRGIFSFINTYDKGSYPTLNAYLKYSTAFDVMLSEHILDTERKEFVDIINKLASLLTNNFNKPLSEDLQSDYKKYVLSYLMNTLDVIAHPINFTVDNDGNFDISINQTGDAYKEKKRVFGYGMPSNIAYVEEVIETKDDNGVTEKKIKRIAKPFTVVDKNNPTNEELANFAKLSPAQKVKWIQNNSSNAGVFSYLDVNLNVSKRRSKAGMHLIDFNDNNVNINVIRQEFMLAVNSKNPLVAATAVDLVKYSMLVEGMRMTKTAVNKIIDNEILYKDFGIDSVKGLGLGINEAYIGRIKAIGTNFSPISEEEVGNIAEMYLRSKPDLKEIGTIRINKSNKIKYNIQGPKRGIYICQFKPNNTDSEEDKKKAIDEFNSKLTSAKILKKDNASNTYYPNSYVRLVDEDKVTRLYKIVKKGGFIALYPLNTLENNEFGIWSANDDNNTKMDKHWYESILTAYTAELYDNELFSEIANAIKQEYIDSGNYENVRYKKTYKINGKVLADTEFNINSDKFKDDISIINFKNAVKNHFVDNLNSEALYVVCSSLEPYIPSTGAIYGSPQTIKFSDGQSVSVRIIKVTPNKRIMEKNPSINSGNAKYVYQVIPTVIDSGIENDPTIEAPAAAVSLPDANAGVLEFMKAQIGVESDPISREFMNHIRNASETQVSASVEFSKNNEMLVTREIAAYAGKMTDMLKNKIENFTRDPEDNEKWIPVLDDKVQKLVGTNSKLLNEYIQISNLANALVDKLAHYTQLKSEDSEVQFYINEIKDTIKRISELPIDEIEQKIAEGYFSSISTNPLVKNHSITLMSPYYRTQGFMWQFDDIMNASNPLVQTLLKDVMDDIEERRLAKARLKKDFKKKVDEIYKAAAAEGLEINISKFINDDGEFITEYIKDFVKRFNELKDAVTDASENGYGSIEHLKAKLEFDKFKAIFINQEAKPEYYQYKAALEENILTNFPEIYSEYMKLYYERNMTNQYIQERGSSEEQLKKLKKLDIAITNLYRPNYYINSEGTFVPRPVRMAGVRYTPEQEREFKLYSNEAASALNTFLSDLRDLRNKTFEYVAVPRFKELLKINLDIIAKAEKRNGDGIPTIPMSQLMENPRYVEAKNWIRNNAAFVIKYDKFNEEGEDKSFGAKVDKALETLGMNRSRKRIEIASRILRVENDENRHVRDERGILDGRQFTKEERSDIKKLQEAQMQRSIYPPFSDASLINSAERSEDIFNEKFYSSMRGNGVKASEYRDKVTEINSLLERCWNPVTDRLDFTMLKDTKENIKLLQDIAVKLVELRRLKSKEGSTNGKAVKEFIETYTDSVPNMEAFKVQENHWFGRSKTFKNALAPILYEVDKDGNYVRDDEGNLIPNKLIFNSIRPKAPKYINGQLNPEYMKWVDTKRTEANQILDGLYRTVPTQYYDDARREAELESKRRKAQGLQEDNEYYNEWFAANHVWNPFTREVEPLQIWTRSEYKYENFEENSENGEWVPRRHQRERKVKDGMVHGIYKHNEDMRNHNYREDVYIINNYRKGAYNGYYDNAAVNELNNYEIELRNYLKQTLINSAETYQGKHYFEQNYLPAARKADPMSLGKVIKEVGKLAGIGTFAKESETPWKNDIGYAEDFNPVMPMTQMLKDSSKGSVYFDKPKPILSAFDGDNAAYIAALNEWKREKQEAEDKNREIHNSLLDKNWIDVIERYLDKAADYNAVLHNKQKLFYLLEQIRKQQTYVINDGSPVERNVDNSLRGKVNRALNKGVAQASEFIARTPGLQVDAQRSSESNTVYSTSVDKNLYEQLSNVIRRLIYDQWVRPDIKQGIARNLQGFTSANYMMLNFRGGIANVTLGETGILAEAAAAEAFNKKEWGIGTLEWAKGIFSYGQGFTADVAGHEDWAYSKQDAAIKYFKSVDYDAKTGVVTELDYEKYSKVLRDTMFSPQTIGEHFMQNSVLFAMLYSHKIVENHDDPRGIGFTFMNKSEYIRVKEAEYLTSILDDNQKEEFEKFKKEISNNPNDFREYAWYRKQDIVEWVAKHLNKSQRDEWAKKVEENRARLSEEFDNLPDIYSQIDLGDDHKMKFVEDTVLDKLSKVFTDTGISHAEQILGQFSNRVRLTNNKIHGNYNRNAAAYIESKWWGALVMQYHKHLPMGILKRWRRRGYYNETRGTVEKGMVASCIDFLSLNADVAKKNCGLTESQADALKSAQFMIAHIFDFCSAIKDTWAITPEYDKANIRRNLGDLSGVAIALLVALALQIGGDDDDDSLGYNLLVYEADRLASEAFMYNPIGGAIEIKKLMSTPVAGQSIISDVFKAAMVAGEMIIKGDDYDPYYHSGRFADENKLSVYIQRRTPIWAGIRNLLDTPDNNHYYKLGKNPIGIVDVEAIADWIKNK